MKLTQVLATEKGIKSRSCAEKSELYKAVQKPSLFSGFNRKYTPKDESGEELASETTKVQMRVREILDQLVRCESQALDVEATKDHANCLAFADVVVDGVVLVQHAPATFLLHLEKEIQDLLTFVAALPTLDPAEVWTEDKNSRLWKSEPTRTARTKKTHKAFVLYQATKEHPAQCQMVTEDETVGHWEQVKVSGAIPESERRTLLARIEKLQTAVKCAREAANMIEAEAKSTGTAVIEWLFGGAQET